MTVRFVLMVRYQGDTHGLCCTSITDRLYDIYTKISGDMKRVIHVAITTATLRLSATVAYSFGINIQCRLDEACSIRSPAMKMILGGTTVWLVLGRGSEVSLVVYMPAVKR